MIIVKMGGSVSNEWRELVSLFIELHRLTDERFLLIPGGGRIAEYVKELGCDDENSHWMAIAAMEINGYHISSMGIKKLSPSTFSEISVNLESVGVLLPYNLLLKNDELPHSWEVTSDSIAIWIAGKINVRKVIKITDVDGVFLEGRLVDEIDPDDLSFESCIDRYSPLLIKKYGVEVFVCNGNHPERVKDYILRERALGTLIKRR